MHDFLLNKRFAEDENFLSKKKERESSSLFNEERKENNTNNNNKYNNFFTNDTINVETTTNIKQQKEGLIKNKANVIWHWRQLFLCLFLLSLIIFFFFIKKRERRERKGKKKEEKEIIDLFLNNLFI